ncbi:hypothetical protein U9M48_017440 [Paspalum notatum var. saurae]|uniref:Uncharacterized protein n=1 Tax=Paspalum notatum var. saurae TaxID=547442 RepID=A0AAQ3T8I9_PASNO
MANERNGSRQVFLVLLVTQVCLLVAMASSAVQGSRPGWPGAVIPESTPECCLYHPDCCQAATVANP